MQTAGKAVAIITARGGSKRIPHKISRNSVESRSWLIPSKRRWLREYLTGSWYPPMMKRSQKWRENMEQKFLSCAVRRRQMIMPLRRMCWKKCWRSMKNVGNILIPCVVSIPPLLLLHLTGWRKQCTCWKKKGGHPASGSTFQLSAPALRGTG